MKKLLIIFMLSTTVTILSDTLSRGGLQSRGVAVRSLRPQSMPQQRFTPADMRPQRLQRIPAKAPLIQQKKQLAAARIGTIKQTTQVHQGTQRSFKPPARPVRQGKDRQNVRTLKRFNRKNLILVGGNLVPWWWYYEDHPTNLYIEDGTPAAGTAQPTQFLEEPNQNELEQTGCYNDCMNRPETKSDEECNRECGATEE